jgi:phosphoglucosamine mutase
VITTPGVAFITGRFDFDAGIVISASHNPYRDNGIKIFLPDGKKVGDDVEKTIEKAVHESISIESGAGEVEFDESRALTFQFEYSKHLISEVEGLSLPKIKIVVDCANGAASDFAPSLFRSLGADVVALHATPDGCNINENCGSLHLEHLQKAVVDERADFGVAFDGDADRALFVDEKGNIVDGDGTLWIMAQFLRDKGGLANDTVIATVMSNIGLEIALASRGLTLVRTPVGDKYVLEELLKSGSELGGEQSGHVIFPKESLVGDGMMTALFMLAALRSKDGHFSELSSGFVRYPQVLVNVHVKEKKPFDDVDEIATASKKIEAQLEGEGRLLLRYSGTENLARVMIEGKDQTRIEEQANGLADVIRASLG